MDYSSDLPDTDPSAPIWDCRWPDPVALRVSAERILRDLPADDPNLNRCLTITVDMDLPNTLSIWAIQTLMVTPWAVERIYWHNPSSSHLPPIQYAISLEKESSGRVAAGQGVLLEVSEKRLVPVVIAWEPETGHYFVETLLHCTLEFDTAQAALAAALGEPPESLPTLSIASTLNKEVSRRNLLGFWRRQK